MDPQTDNLLEDNEIISIVKSCALDRKYELLSMFLDSLDEKRKENLMRYDEYCRALIALNLEKREFETVYRIIETGHFGHTEDLIEVWDQAHYREREAITHRPLNSLMRFRIRKKFPPPRNICPSGERLQHKLPEGAKETLKNWFSRHANNPYPSKLQREDLCKATGLTDNQVKTWFSNARRKVKQDSFEKEKAPSKDSTRAVPSESVKPQFYLRPSNAATFENEKWSRDWIDTSPLQNLQEWQKKSLGSPSMSLPFQYQDASPSYEMRFWPTEDYQTYSIKDSVFPVNFPQYAAESCYYGESFSQPLTYQTSVPSQCLRPCCLRDSYDASIRYQYSNTEVQPGDTEAALMLLDLQRPLVSGGMAPQTRS
ncbi:protein sine oculis-like [Ostrea edulis]|uniref:protein sine oculis-like n=1 Tax=Ostrea edulis TaxID=37623 RepID=UPI0024AF771F|nr:protein sine oculis-like [Ostrea edulis]